MNRAHLTQLKLWLTQYETKYQMSSADFLPKFLAAELPVTPDFLEWKVFCELHAQAVANTSETKRKKFCNG